MSMYPQTRSTIRGDVRAERAAWIAVAGNCRHHAYGDAIGPVPWVGPLWMGVPAAASLFWLTCLSSSTSEGWASLAHVPQILANSATGQPAAGEARLFLAARLAGGT